MCIIRKIKINNQIKTLLLIDLFISKEEVKLYLLRKKEKRKEKSKLLNLYSSNKKL